MYANNDSFENGSSRSIEYYETDPYEYAVDDLHDENNDESNFDSEPTEGMWIEHCALNYSNSPVTSLEYDSNLELLWASYGDGRVSSFAIKLDCMLEEYEQPQRYSSFTASEEPVFQLITIHSCILSVSMSAIQMHTVGGLSLGKFSTAPTGINEDGNETIFSYTCAVALRPPGALVTADSVGSTHILAGTSSNFAYIYDISVQGGDPLMIYDVCSPTVCVRSSDLHLAVAGADGKVRLLDSRLRSMQITHTFDAHTGPVRDLCLQPDGLTMLTCGVISRPVNPFDPKSPVNVRLSLHNPISFVAIRGDFSRLTLNAQKSHNKFLTNFLQYVPDPLVKVFDIGTQRQLSPMSMSVSSPITLRYVPASSRTGDEAPSPSILLGSTTGIVQVCPLNGDMINSQLLYAPLTDRKEIMTAMAVSSSGQVMCVGTSNGGIAQYVLKMPEGLKPKINEVSIVGARESGGLSHTRHCYDSSSYTSVFDCIVLYPISTTLMYPTSHSCRRVS
jgi:WD40 repeat protein